MKTIKSNLFLNETTKKNIYKIPIIISIITLIIVIFLIPLPFIVFNKQFYYSEYEKNDVYSKIGVNNTQAITFGVFTYFRCDEKVVLERFNRTCDVFLSGNYTKPNNSGIIYFTDNEKSHLSDVKNLIRIGFGILYISFFVFLTTTVFLFIILKRKTNGTKEFFNLFTKIIFVSSLVLLLLYAVIFIISINFNGFFSQFHKLFFPQGNYLFDNDSLLITMYPQNFFFDAASRIFFAGLITTIILIILSFTINIILKKQNKK